MIAFGRAVGAAFDRFVTPGILGLALGMVSVGLIG